MAKSPLLLLHGALGAADQFSTWIPVLSEHFDVHTLEFEGHGAQAFPEGPFRIEAFAENLRAYIEEQRLAPVNIFGYSMGGYVAMYLARKQSDLIGRIFTFASKLDWRPETSAKEVKMLNPATIKAKVPHFAKSLEARHHGNEWEEHLGRTAEMMLDLGAQPRLGEPDFAALDLPIRMGLGDRDRMVSLTETAQAYRKLPQGELMLLPKTPHPIEKIDLQRLLPSLLDFFKKN